MIEVWRPAGRTEHRKPQHKPHHRRPRPQQPAQAGEAPAPAEQAAAPADASAEQKPDQHPPRGPRRDFGEKRADQQGRHDRQQKQESQRKRDERKEQGGDRPRGRRDRGAPVDRAERDMYFAKPGMRMRANKEPDPNSPFAKLAALKQQLEDNAKS